MPTFSRFHSHYSSHLVLLRRIPFKMEHRPSGPSMHNINTIQAVSVYALHPHRTAPKYTWQIVYPQFLQPVADNGGWGLLAQRLTFCQGQELDFENVSSSTLVQPPGTLFHPTFTTLLTPVHSENDSRVYFLIVLITDYCWRSWTCRVAAPYKSRVDWLIEREENLAKFLQG